MNLWIKENGGYSLKNHILFLFISFGFIFGVGLTLFVEFTDLILLDASFREVLLECINK